MKTWLLLALVGLLGLSMPVTAEPPATPRLVSFRLVFKAYDGDRKSGIPLDKMSFQIDTLDLRQHSVFLKIGDRIPNTDFKLVTFDFKEAYNVKFGENEDVSELTIVDELDGRTVVLPINKVVNVPAAKKATK